MDLRVVHGTRDSIVGSMFAPRVENREEPQFADFRSREADNMRRPDVRHKPFMQPVYRTSKDIDSRQRITPSERLNGVIRPEFTSLADVYEGALRNVLGIQLHLALDDQQSFAQDAINDLLFNREKSLPGHHRGMRHDQNSCIKRGSENHQHSLPSDGNKDIKKIGSFQGRTSLRDPLRVSAGGSAFHVPPKKPRLDEDIPYSERGFPMEHYTLAPRMTFPPDYPPNSFHSAKGAPGMYNRRVNAPEAVSHAYGTNGIHIPSPRDRYSLWSFGHHRDLSALFPVRCSSVESDRRLHRGSFEDEQRRTMDFDRVNGFMHQKTAVQVKNEKDSRDEITKRDQKPILTEKRSPLTSDKETGLERDLERDKLSPNSSSSPKSKQVHSLLIPRRSSPTHGAVDFRIKTRYRSALRKLETRREGRKGNGDDDKEEFLFKLGLERIDA